MTVLGSSEIRKRLSEGEIFKWDTWDEKGVKEASYALRLAWDGLVVDGKPYPPGYEFEDTQIIIYPGQIAILSTEEVIKMPGDLTGKLGVRLNFAAIGLVGLMGIQVDPYYGLNTDYDERLYLRVANLGNEPIPLKRADRVFNIELHESRGAEEPSVPKERGWDRMQNLVRGQRNANWTYITRVEHNARDAARDIEERFHPLILFGVVLLAVTMLGVASAVMINTDASSAPSWVADWGWAALVCTFVVGGIATAILVGAEAYRTIKKELGMRR